MSTKKRNLPAQIAAKNNISKIPPGKTKPESINILYPLQKGFNIPYPLLWLALAALIIYFPTFSFGFTDLDDSIFIRDFHEYNENLHNLITSFSRGVFNATKDSYYRPLFLDTMILNYQASGLSEAGYHVVNVLFHMVSVLLLYKLFTKLQIKNLHAFLLCLIFAVHPVLSEAVAWIPGRNDTLLAIFTLSFLIASINYSETAKTKWLVIAALFLILSFFTKETAVFDAPIAFILLVVVLKISWRDKHMLIQYGVWFACFVLWFIARSSASLQPIPITTSQLLSDFIHRLPLIIQYLGKIFIPVNLSVFPIIEDTVYYYGIAAILLLAVIIYLSKDRDWRILGSGLAIFLLFLLPVLLVPKSLNEQTFEHRLYLPMIGILLVLTQTVLLKNKLNDKQLFISGMIVVGILSAENYYHQKNFAGPVAFWTQAVETSPHSAYANMMLAAREDDVQLSYKLFRKAYQLNPKEKYLNFYYGVMLQKQDSVLASEKYLLAEKNTSDYYECDFYLARVAMEQKNFNGAIAFLVSYLKRDPKNQIANNNLLLLYIDTKQPAKAVAQVRQMQLIGIDVPKQVLQSLGLDR